MTLRRVTLAFLVLYTLATLSPFFLIPFHIAPPHWITSLTTLTGCTFALLHAGQREGWSRALQLLALVFGVALLFESAGVATGWIYGPYHYTDTLGAKFLGLVPYLIPVAWFMMSYPSYVIADRLVPNTWKPWQRLLGVAALGGLAMTAWDLVMDPFMVRAGHWVWEVEGAYFGIPLQNFWGWWLTVFVTFALYKLITARGDHPAGTHFDRLALTAYLITMVGMVLASLAAGTAALALIGLFAMLPWPVAGLLKPI
jgi:putative membrane protein